MPRNFCKLFKLFKLFGFHRKYHIAVAVYIDCTETHTASLQFAVLCQPLRYIAALVKIFFAKLYAVRFQCFQTVYRKYKIRQLAAAVKLAGISVSDKDIRAAEPFQFVVLSFVYMDAAFDKVVFMGFCKAFRFCQTAVCFCGDRRVFFLNLSKNPMLYFSAAFSRVAKFSQFLASAPLRVFFTRPVSTLPGPASINLSKP